MRMHTHIHNASLTKIMYLSKLDKCDFKFLVVKMHEMTRLPELNFRLGLVISDRNYEFRFKI